jgi:AraC-like DNA-binding protein
LVFDRAYLDLPLTTAHASASQLAQEQCERALAELNQPQLINRVREAMLTARGEFQDLAGVAKTLGVSERTLKRKLQAEGAAFSEISDNVRCEHASTLLRDPKLSIDEVAERTGYADTSNFTRAFRRWTGKTPAAFRKG